MSESTKKIGVLTSGGDCGGLNAAIRAVVRRAILGHGWQVFGIAGGTDGLATRPLQAAELTLYDVEGPMGRLGGTILGSNSRGDIFKTPGLVDKVMEGYRQLGLDAMIVLGGDGSLEIYNKLSQSHGLKFVGIPKTVDNDIGMTENAIGYDTAVSVATEALDRLQATAASHYRIMILEVMGRDAGHVALAAGVAGQADVILIPEIPYSLDAVAEHIGRLGAHGQHHALVIVSEAVKTMGGEKLMQTFADGSQRYGGIGAYIAHELEKKTKADVRLTSLGHTLRGAAPGHLDRTIAAAFGIAAVDLLRAERYGHMVAWQNRKVIAVPVEEAIKAYQAVDPNGTLVKTARGLGISFGD
ncbi:MAG: ATP-dependent 6-phosphofructokinase [Bdellovibrionales bacterium]